MRVYFHGGPHDGEFEEIPDGRDRWDVYVRPKELDLPFAKFKDLPTPKALQIVTYVPSGDWRLKVLLGLFLTDIHVFVPRNTVNALGMPADYRMN